MSTAEFLLSSWTWSPLLVAGAAAGLIGYFLAFGRRGHTALFLAGWTLAVLALASPLDALARGYLFSAHMTQHLVLLLFVPGLFVMSLPEDFRLLAPAGKLFRPVLSWSAGVGAMWLWHVPAFCDAAAANPLVHSVQSFSLLGLGAAFWWPIAAPAAAGRLHPLGGIVYLATACLACSALGILITLTPLQVCPIFCAPRDPMGLLGLIRNDWGIGADRDRQIGGLIMWVPMCLVYLGAVFVELARWFHEPAASPVRQPLKGGAS